MRYTAIVLLLCVLQNRPHVCFVCCDMQGSGGTIQDVSGGGLVATLLPSESSPAHASCLAPYTTPVFQDEFLATTGLVSGLRLLIVFLNLYVQGTQRIRATWTNLRRLRYVFLVSLCSTMKLTFSRLHVLVFR